MDPASAAPPASSPLHRGGEEIPAGPEALEHALQDLAEALDALVWILDAPARRYLFVSPNAGRLTGYPAEEWLADPGVGLRLVHPDDREGYRTRWERAMHEGGEHAWECRAVTRDGRVVWVHQRVRVSPDGTAGDPVVRGISIDVTERRRAEAEREALIREQAARVAAESSARGAEFLAEASRVLASSFDLDTTLARVARLAVPFLADYCVFRLHDTGEGLNRLGLAHVDPARERLLRAIPPGIQRPPEDHPLTQAFRRGESLLIHEVTPEVIDQVIYNPATRPRARELGPVSYLFVPLLSTGEPIGMITLAMSDSGRRFGKEHQRLAEELAARTVLAITSARLYVQAQEATRDRDHVLAVVAHDLRNPLAAVTLITSVLLDQLPADGSRADEREQVESIARSAERMNELIQDLLEVTRVREGRIPVELRPEPPAELLREAVETMRPLATTRSLALEAGLDAGLPWVLADRGRVLQLLSNLVGNAVKFTPEGGRIELGASLGDGEVCFRVRDTGPGIAPEHLPHIFGRGWQASRTDRRGIGLGLAIAKGIVEAHGGRIWVESRPGEGSTFYFTLSTAPG